MKKSKTDAWNVIGVSERDPVRWRDAAHVVTEVDEQVDQVPVMEAIHRVGGGAAHKPAHITHDTKLLHYSPSIQTPRVDSIRQ